LQLMSSSSTRKKKSSSFSMQIYLSKNVKNKFVSNLALRSLTHFTAAIYLCSPHKHCVVWNKALLSAKFVAVILWFWNLMTIY